MLEDVCYCPNGSLIAGFEKTIKGPKIIFWEKNGLRHGELNLDIQDYNLKNL